MWMVTGSVDALLELELSSELELSLLLEELEELESVESSLELPHAVSRTPNRMDAANWLNLVIVLSH